MKALRSLGFFFNTLLIFLGVPLLGWGLRDIGGFFASDQRLGYAVVVVLLGLAIGYQGYENPEGIRGSRGEAGKRLKRQSVVRYALVLLLFGALCFLPFADRRSIGVMGEVGVLRWVGVVCFGLGAVLVFWSGIALGRLYSADVTVQEGHRLVTSGIYRTIRHPRYLGGLVYAFGLSFLFRSWIGLAVSLISVIVFILRIRDEEVFMQREFGEEWEAYCKYTWRLIPFIY